VCVCAKIVPNFWFGRPEFIDTDVLFANIVFTPKKEEVMESKGSVFLPYYQKLPVHSYNGKIVALLYKPSILPVFHEV
jgi:hypothetical protein